MARGTDEEGCFGGGAAAADLDGDGRRDLVVAVPRCLDRQPDRLAVYRGEGAMLAGEGDGIRVSIDWANANPPPFNVPMFLAPGDVDGDEHADLLVSSPAGAVLYRGRADLAAMFAEPVFRAEGEVFGSARLGDLDGDGRDDIAAAVGADAVLFLAGGGPAPAFAPSRAIPGAPTGGGDVDGDGRADLFIDAPDGTVQLYLGCEPSRPGCDGGVGAEPAWAAAGFVAGSDMDLDADGRSDVALTDFGRVFVYTTNRREEVLSGTPTWTVQGDAVFPGFGRSMAAASGVLGGGAELLVGALARAYLFRVPEHGDGPLELVWAFPAEDALTEAWPIDYAYSVASAGDLDADDYADFVVTATSAASGVAMVFHGGQPAGQAPRLPEPLACGSLSGGLADLTVDADALSRSLRITREEFEPDACEVLEGCVGRPGQRRLLRFTASIPNLGAGDAIVPSPKEAPELYRFDECHGHDHLVGFSTYRLIDERGGEVLGHKQGYALLDFAPYCAESAAPVDFAPSQGISAGWADVYIANYACQWIDITDLPDSTYELRVSVDDTDVIPEGGEHPNQVSVTVAIAGDHIRPVGSTASLASSPGRRAGGATR